MRGRHLVWVAVVAFAALTWWSAVRAESRLRANLVLGVTESRGAQIAARATELGDEQLRPLVAAGIQNLRRVLPDAPADARLALAIGSHFLMLENFTEAAAWYERSIELEPRPETYLNLGRAAHIAGDREAAIENFRKAVEIDVTLRREVPAELVDELPPPPRP